MTAPAFRISVAMFLALIPVTLLVPGLDELVVQRLGGTREMPIHARIIATTHRDLERAVKDGTFRLDLFYRLRVVHLELPSLRERTDDIPMLIDHYLQLFCDRVKRSRITVDEGVMRELVAYRWPGNVRELANTIEGEASLMSLEESIMATVPAALTRAGLDGTAGAGGAVPSSPAADVIPMDEVERRVYAHALLRCKGNVARAAKALGVARGTFYNKLRRHGLNVE
jgi:DNA-binding NtrC family response regulator